MINNTTKVVKEVLIVLLNVLFKAPFITSSCCLRCYYPYVGVHLNQIYNNIIYKCISLLKYMIINDDQYSNRKW